MRLGELDQKDSSHVPLGTPFLLISQLRVRNRNGLLRAAGAIVPMLLEQPKEMLGTNQVDLAGSLEEGQYIRAGRVPIKVF